MQKTIPLLACFVLLFVADSTSHAQVLYGTNFDGTNTYPYNDPSTYQNSTTSGLDLVGQGGGGTGSASQTWTGTDDPSVSDGNGNYHGGLNAVVSSTIGSPGASTSSNAATLYGELLDSTTGNGYSVYPGAASVFVGHPFTLTTSAMTYGYALNTDFEILPPASTTATSGYGFAFLNSSGMNVISVQFIKDTTTTTTSGQDTVRYQSGTGATSATSNAVAIDYQGVYHLTLSVNTAAGTASISLNGTSVFSNINIGTAAAASATEVGGLQFINGTSTAVNGDYMGAGDDQMTFDNFNVTVAPEPSTYVMMGLGLIGLFGLMKFRRAA